MVHYCGNCVMFTNKNNETVQVFIDKHDSDEHTIIVESIAEMFAEIEALKFQIRIGMV